MKQERKNLRQRTQIKKAGEIGSIRPLITCELDSAAKDNVDGNRIKEWLFFFSFYVRCNIRTKGIILLFFSDYSS